MYNSSKKKLRGKQGLKFKNFRIALKAGDTKHMFKFSATMFKYRIYFKYPVFMWREIRYTVNHLQNKYRLKLSTSQIQVGYINDDFIKGMYTCMFKVKEKC